MFSNSPEPAQPTGTATELLARIAAGDEKAKHELINVAYDELRQVAAGMMRGERAEHTLQPTALVHEAAVRLIYQPELVELPSRRYFFWAMARAMRQVLIDHARTRKRLRRGGDQKRVALDDVIDLVEKSSGVDLVALDDALVELETVNVREYRVVVSRFFGGLTMEEIAEDLGVSRATVQSDWKFARVWLRQQLSEEA